MNKNRHEDEVWHYHQQSIFAEPSFMVVTVKGREWVRDRPNVCPVCGVCFFGYRPVLGPVEAVKSESILSCRQTCGHPKCWEAECDRHMRMDGKFVKACEERFNKPEQPIERKLKLDHL